MVEASPAYQRGADPADQGKGTCPVHQVVVDHHQSSAFEAASFVCGILGQLEPARTAAQRPTDRSESDNMSGSTTDVSNLGRQDELERRWTE